VTYFVVHFSGRELKRGTMTLRKKTVKHRECTFWRSMRINVRNHIS